jgi:hypothetical protein
MVKTIIGWIDTFMPGYKTYALALLAFLMFVAQWGSGYWDWWGGPEGYSFSKEVWGMVFTGMGISYKLGQDRK